MRVLICGSRSWNDIDMIANFLQRMQPDTTIIHGDAVGADTIADVIAQELGFKIIKFPISKEDWKKFGKQAGWYRNKRMLEEGQPDLVIGFIDTLVKSPGTHMMLELAESNGVRIFSAKKPCWKEVCPTCGESFNAIHCSNAFHMCRECTWTDGEITVPCKNHTPKDKNES